MSSAGRDMFTGCAAILIMFLGIYIGYNTAMDRADRHEQTAIANAVSEALENNRPVMTCKEQSLIDSIKGLANNGVHMETYRLYINIGNAPEWEAWDKYQEQVGP